MSQIENSRICPIARTSSANTNSQRNGESRPGETTNPFLKAPLRSIYQFSSGNTTSTATVTSSIGEKRLNYALQSRKVSSDGQVTGGAKFADTQSEVCTHSRNRSTFEFWQHLHQGQLQQDSSTEQATTTRGELNPVISTATDSQLEHLQEAVGNVDLGDGTRSDNNNSVSTRQPHQSEKVDVAREVETEQGGGGDEVFAAEAGTQDGASSTVDADAKATHTESVASLQILAACKQPEQSLKPILKRKDPPERLVPLAPVATSQLLPPILKKRDSFSESHACATKSAANNAPNVTQSGRPASILKNRQPRGSYSFDENINSGEVSSNAPDDGIQLKPILKKKSWSIEEKVPANVNHSHVSVDGVKGILKSSSDKLTASTSSSRKNSATIDECASPGFFTLSSCSASTAHSTNSSASPTKAMLKGILKASSKNRSASISPSTSSESLSDELDLDRAPLSSPKPSRSAIRRRASLDEESSSDMRLDSVAGSDIAFNHHADSVSCFTGKLVPTSTSSARPALRKANALPCDSDGSISSSDSPPSEQCFGLHHVPDIPASTPPFLDAMSNESPPHESRSSVNSPDSDENYSSMNLTVLRRKNATSPSDAAKSRPKSCFVTSTELFGEEPKSLANSSIAQRLALLKQSGEEGWRNRVHKSDVEKEIIANADEVQLRPKKPGDSAVGARGSVIANRLSCLMESQAQWKCRVSESDAKQFTVASKQSRQSAIPDSELKMDPTEKVVLRGTPKRLGLRGSTLNESALSAVSSKLNNVLRPDKSLLSGPTSPLRKKDDSSLIFDAVKAEAKPSSEPTTTASSIGAPSATVFLTRPDDEESFGSFFGLDSSKLDHILKQEENTPEPSLLSLDSLPTEPTSLLTHVKRSRIQVPKRRAASSHNPIKQLNKSAISVDSYSLSKVPNSANGGGLVLPSSGCAAKVGSAKVDHLAKNNMAISALAGLASKEDFKNVATKLRSSSAVSSPGNDAWRQHDLKNSIQSRMLILVKGRRHAQLRLIEPTWRSLNLSDSFITVTKDAVYAFVGQFSNIIERTKCIEVAEQIRKRRELCYRAISTELVLIDGHLDSVQANLFNKVLPMLKELDFADADKADWEKLVASSQSDMNVDDDDEYYEESLICTNMIFKAVYDEGSDSVALAPVETCWGRSPRHQLLQPESVFVFDFGTEMYVWIGKNVSNAHRKKAVESAKDLWLKGYDYSEIDISPFGAEAALKADKRPDWAWFTRVNQNMETVLLKDKFFNWPAFTLTRSVKKRSQQTPKADSTKDTQNTHHTVKKDLSQELNLFAVDARQMIAKPYQEPNLVLESVSLGRGSNDILKDEDGLSVKIVSLEVQCFYIDDAGERIELTGSDANFLYTGESYYIRWKYRLSRISRCLKTGGESKHSEEHGGRDRLCYFVWQGRDARNTQRGTTALNAIDKLREEGASQEVIENGHEFPAFLRIFNGCLVILLGKRNQASSQRKYRMFALKSTQPSEMFLAEVECSPRNLRSRASFIFIHASSSKVIYLWHGCKASQVIRQLTRQFLEDNLLSTRSTEFGFSTSSAGQCDIVELEEGKENRDFFSIINSSSMESSSPKRTSRSNLQREIYFSLMDDGRQYDFTPRLFHFTTSAARIFQAHEVVPSYMPASCHSETTVLSYPFTQEDIYLRAAARPTFFLLDNHYEVYLWESKFPFVILGASSNKEGDKSNSTGKPRMIDIETEILTEANLTTGSLAQLWLAERKCALETTLAYCHAKNPSEPPTAYVISAGLEPHSFCGLFPTWIYYENVASLHIEDGRKPGQQILVQEVLAQLRDIHTSTYSYEVLKRGSNRPEGLNTLCLESYLEDSEFEKILGFNREEFYALPTWKQKIIKQEKELF